MTSADSALTVVLVYPDLLGTYGDRGNAAGPRAPRPGARPRLPRRGGRGARPPAPRTGDIYLIGGGEDAAHAAGLGAPRRRAEGRGRGRGRRRLPRGLRRLPAAERRVLGTGRARAQRPRAAGRPLRSHRRTARRGRGAGRDGEHGGFLTGFENHQGDARLGPAARPLARLVRAWATATGATEGAVQGRVIGSYLHGPVLVRNAGLADHLLQLVAGQLAPFEDEPVERLRRERRRRDPRRSPPWRRRLPPLTPGRTTKGPPPSGGPFGSGDGDQAPVRRWARPSRCSRAHRGRPGRGAASCHGSPWRTAPR